MTNRNRQDQPTRGQQQSSQEPEPRDEDRHDTTPPSTERAHRDRATVADDRGLDRDRENFSRDREGDDLDSEMDEDRGIDDDALGGSSQSER